LAFLTVFRQVFEIFLLMGIGFLAQKAGFISEKGSKDMTAVLLYIVSPCVVIKAFQQPYTSSAAQGLLVSFLCSAGIYLASIAISEAVFNKKVISDIPHRNALKFVTVYSNSGFMGIPLTAAMFGTQGVFYGTPYLVSFTVFNWTHGIALYEGKSDLKSKLKVIIKNPNISAVVIGILLFVLSLKLPPLLDTGITYIYNLNTPLSMLVIGDSIARMKFGEIFRDKLVWPGIAIRNLVMPALALLALCALGIKQEVLLPLVLMVACPVASMVVLFAKMKDMDAGFPTKLMTLSTLLSIITIPLMISLAYFVIK
jgi:predicted permease